MIPRFFIILFLILSCNKKKEVDKRCIDPYLDKIPKHFSLIKLESKDCRYSLGFYDSKNTKAVSVFTSEIFEFSDCLVLLNKNAVKTDTIIVYSVNELKTPITSIITYDHANADTLTSSLYKIKYDTASDDTVYKFRFNGLLRFQNMDYVICYSKRRGIIGVYLSNYYNSNNIEENVFLSDGDIYIDKVDSLVTTFNKVFQ